MVNSCNFSASCWLSNAGLISFPGVRPGFPPRRALRRATANSGGEAASCPPRTAYTGRQAARPTASSERDQTVMVPASSRYPPVV